MSPRLRLQSAMEYLMTYGWAILVIATVLGALFQLGVFNSNSLSFSSSCLASAGFLCQNPTLNASGSLAVKFGEIGLGTITITNTACTSNVTAPTSTQSISAVLVSGQTSILTFNCPLTSNSLGSKFKGYIWITYNTQTQSGVVDRIAVVTSKVSTFGSSAAILGGNAIASLALPYIYCVGGFNSPGGTYNQVYYSSVSSSGVGTWTSTNSYPTAIRLHDCITSSGYIYCVAGYTGGSVITNVYSAPISANGIGTWTSQSAYPFASYYHHCVQNSGYVYCIAGSDVNAATGNVVYASISAGTVGVWSATTSYPIAAYGGSCVTSGGYVYCVAGNNGADTNNVYYASLSSSGVGAWSATTNYPTTVSGLACTNSGGYIYCLGNAAGTSTTLYSAPLSSSGIGAWVTTNAYPTGVSFSTVTAINGYLYVVTNTGVSYSTGVYYAPIIAGGVVGSWTSTNSYPLAWYTGVCKPYS